MRWAYSFQTQEFQEVQSIRTLFDLRRNSAAYTVELMQLALDESRPLQQKINDLTCSWKWVQGESKNMEQVTGQVTCSFWHRVGGSGGGGWNDIKQARTTCTNQCTLLNLWQESVHLVCHLKQNLKYVQDMMISWASWIKARHDIKYY